MVYHDRMQTADDILALFKEYSIHDKSGDARALGTEVTVAKTHSRNEGIGDIECKIRHRIMPDADRVANLELKEVKSKGAYDQALKAAQGHLITKDRSLRKGHTMEELIATQREVEANFPNSEKGRSTLVCTYHDDAVEGVTVPCYQLPWNSWGGAVELNIPDNGGGGPAADNPILFMTSVLSGCSIYVTGTRKQPRVFHCGTEGTTEGNNAAFWKDIMRQIGVDEDAADVHAIHAQSYMRPRGGDDETPAMVRQREADQVLRERQAKSREIEELRSWGSVFGIRDGDGNWMFFLQENITIKYHKIKYSKLGMGSKRISVGEEIQVARPILCRQIFPEGGGGARLFESLRALPKK